MHLIKERIHLSTFEDFNNMKNTFNIFSVIFIFMLFYSEKKSLSIYKLNKHFTNFILYCLYVQSTAILSNSNLMVPRSSPLKMLYRSSMHLFTCLSNVARIPIYKRKMQCYWAYSRIRRIYRGHKLLDRVNLKGLIGLNVKAT